MKGVSLFVLPEFLICDHRILVGATAYPLIWGFLIKRLGD